MGSLEESVDGGIGEHAVREHLTPFRDIAIRCQHQSSAVLAPIDEIEDLFGDLAVHGDRCPIIDDPELAGEYALEELIERALGLC